MAKISLFVGLSLLSAALFVSSIFVNKAQAGLFSSAKQVLLPGQIASGSMNSSVNSQSIRLLEPAIHVDPNPAKGGGDISVVDGMALLPETGPSGTMADIADAPTSSTISVYIVRPGDTLGEIAEMFDVSTNTIRWANDIAAGGIKPGQTLVILPITGVRHTAVKGDTIESLAKKYKADADEIRDYNALSIQAKLAVGDVVIIPDGTVAAPKPVAKRPTATAPYRGGAGADLGGFLFGQLPVA